MLDNAMGIDSR